MKRCCARAAAVVAVALLALLARPEAIAHGGEDHGDARAAPTAGVVPGAPRASAAGDEFELVATIEGGRLLLYVDRYATNEPVAAAHVEVDSGAFKATAAALGPGVYAVADGPFAAAGRHPLTVSVQMDAASGGASDLLALELDVAAPAHAQAPPAALLSAWGIGTGSMFALAALAVLGAATAIVAVRRRSGAGRRNAEAA